MKIELLYFEDCPHYAPFAAHVRELLHARGISDRPELVAVTSPEEAVSYQFLGSPTLRINGVDVDPHAAAGAHFGLQCRLYQTTTGTSGTPPDDWIIAALVRSQGNGSTGRTYSRGGRHDVGSE